MQRKIVGRLFDGLDFDGTKIYEVGINNFGKISSLTHLDDSELQRKIKPTQLLLPGRIDMHVHGRDCFDINPGDKGFQGHKEDSYTLSLALMQGGATHAVCMPNLENWVVDSASYEKQLDWMNDATSWREKPLVPLDMYALVAPGTKPFDKNVFYKLLWNTFGPTNFPSDGEVPNTLANYKGQVVKAHCETIAGMNPAGRTHYDKRPKQAGVDATKIFLDAATRFGFEAHVAHVPSPEVLDVINEYKSRGLNVKSEITPQVLLLNVDDFEYSTGRNLLWGQQNPALPNREDMHELRRRVKEFDIFATDHAPHTIEEKLAGMSGMPQASTAGQAYLELVSDGIISLADYVKMSSTIPGEQLEAQLGRKTGRIIQGYDASFMEVNLGKQQQFIDEDIASRCGWTPFSNKIFRNEIPAVHVGGKRYTQLDLQRLRVA